MIGEVWLALAPPISPVGLLLLWSPGPVKVGREGGLLSDRGFESSVMIGVTAGAWLALAPPISRAGLLL